MKAITTTFRFSLALAAGTALTLLASAPARALETIQLNYGSLFQLDLPVSELETFAQTGEASDNLQLLLDVGKVDPAEAQQMLSRELTVDSALTKRMLDSYLGEVLLKEMGSVVNPEAGQEPWQKIRTALVSASGDNRVTAIEVLKSYQSSTMSINGEKAMTIFGRMMTDFDDVKQLLGFNSLEDVTGAFCKPR